MEMSFGDWLKIRRRQMDLTQKALARQANCGLGTIRKIENGSRRPSIALATVIGEALNIPEQEMPAFIQFARSVSVPIQPPSFNEKQVITPQIELLKTSLSFASIPPHNLPFKLTPIIGRDGEISELVHLLLRTPQRLITLVGVGGIGKTRLATAVGHAILERSEHPFQDGIFLISLASLENPENIPSLVAHTIDFQFSSGRPSRRHQLTDHLKSKKMLLIMDNFEQIREGFPLLLEILQSAAGIKILVTSKELLGVQGEQKYPLRSLSYPPGNVAPSQLDEYGAPILFVDRATNLQPDFFISDDNVGELLDICRLVDGMPLALIMAAGWIDVFNMAEIVGKLKKNLDILEANMRDLPARHQSMRVVFDSTWGFLSDKEKEIYKALSIFRGGFTLAAARKVAKATPNDLKQLMSRSLLNRRANGRFEQHELLRQFAAQVLAQDASLERNFRRRHSAYFCRYVGAMEPNLKNHLTSKTETEIELEFENIRTAWKWAIAHGQESLVNQAISGLGSFFLRHRHLEGIETIFRPAWENTSSFETFSNRTQAHILAWLSQLLSREYMVEMMQEGEEIARLALSHLDLAGERGQDNLTPIRALGLMALGNSQPTPEKSIASLEKALALYTELNMRWEMAYILRRLVVRYFRLDNREKVVDYNLRSQQLYEAVGDLAMSNYVKTFVGTGFFQYNNNFGKAERYLQEALAWFKENGPPSLLANSWSNWMNFLIYAGRFQEALAVRPNVLAIRESWAHSSIILLHNAALMHLGLISEMKEEAMSRLEIASKRTSESGNGYYYMHLGFGALIESNMSLARDYFEPALKTIQKSEGVGWTQTGMGYADLREGNDQEAARWLSKALSIATNHQHTWTALYAFPLAALLMAEKGEIGRSIELYSLACTFDFVSNSRLFYHLTGEKVERLAGSLPEGMAEEAQAIGRSLDFWQTAESLLQELLPA